MKRLIYKLVGVVGLSLFAFSCEETMYDYPKFSTIIYLKDGGVKEIEMSNTTPMIEIQVTVGKGGVEKNRATDFVLSPMTAEELVEYNDIYKTNYVQLEETYFTLPAKTSFTTEESQKTVSVNLKIQDIVSDLDYRNTNYALLLKLTSDATVNNDMDVLVISPDIFTPKVSFDENTKVQSTNVNLGGEPEIMKFQFPFYLDFGGNDKAYEVTVQTDENALQALVTEYNQVNGTDYKLLNSMYYEMPAAVAASEDRVTGDVDVQLKAINTITEEGTFILPVQMIGNNQSTYFETDDKPCYLLVNIQKVYNDDELMDITSSLSAQSFSGNNWSNNESYDKLIDKQWESGANGTFYQSAWSTADKEAHGECTAEYGLSININLDREYKAIKFKYVSTREGTRNISSPHKIRFYGSMDGEYWIPLSDEITGLPEVRSTEWYVSPIMQGNVKHIKLAVLESKNKNGGIEYLTSNGTCIISEIEVWAAE